jgi:hypothetical protein
MRSVPKFKLIEGGAAATKLTAQQARQLVEQARGQVQHGTGFTSATVAVLEALLFKLSNRATGQCFPSLATIAQAARISVDTVKRAVTQLERSGFLKRAARWAVWAIAGTTVRVRTSNSYQFLQQQEGREGASAKCACKTEAISIKDIDSLKAGLARQAQVAIDWASRLESDARRSVAQQLALLGFGKA